MPVIRKPLPDADLLRACLDYDPLSGKLTWKIRPDWTFTRPTTNLKRVIASWNGQFPNTEAFTSTVNTGYKASSINGRAFLAHRIIWKLVTGEEPDFIDHIDGVRSNNRWENLRSVDKSTNSKNVGFRSTGSGSGLMGVHFHRGIGSWTANISVSGKLKHLGVFKSKEAAHVARLKAERDLGFHRNHGRKVAP